MNTNMDIKLINNSKLLQRKYYVTNTRPGSFIINAITGKPYNIKIGTFETQRLFRAYDTTGYVSSKGFLLHPQSEQFPNRESVILYYDSPEEYLRHYEYHAIPFDSLKLWNNKQKMLFPDGVFSLEGYKLWNSLSYDSQLNYYGNNINQE